MAMTASEALERVIAELELGYAEGPLNTPSGGAIAIVYRSHPVDLSKIVIPRWIISQESRRGSGVLMLRADQAPKTLADMPTREPLPGDVIVLGKPSWINYRPDLLRVDPHHWWLRLSRYQKGKEWTFLRAQRNCPVVIDVAVEDRELDLILKRHIQWAGESEKWQDFLTRFET